MDDRTLLPTLLPWVLERQRGGCLGLGALALALSEDLGLGLEGVLVPGHFFVRWRGPGGVRGIELLREGQEMPERWYRERYPMPPGNRLYLRGLAPDESLAVLRFNLANALRESGQLARALQEYRAVVGKLPELAEAQANLGLTYQRLHQLDRAEEAYRAAERANPTLPGLRENREQLHRESGRLRE